MSFQKEIARNFFQVGLLKYSGLVVVFLGSAVISRVLTPAEYGVQAIGALYYGLVLLFLDAGFSMVLIREIDALPFQRSVRLFVLLTGCVLAGILAAASFPLASWYDDQRLLGVFWLYAAVILLSALPIVEEAVLSRREEFQVVARAALVATVVQVLLTYLFAVAGLSYYALILPLLAVPLVKFALYRRKIHIGGLRGWRRFPNKATFRRIRNLLKNYSYFRILVYASSNVDNLLVSKLYATNTLGLYNRAYSFNRLPVQIITGVISTIQLPMFRRLKAEGNSVKAEFSDYVQVLGAIAFPAVVVFHLFSYEISELIWGEDWREVGKYLYPLSILLPTTMMLSACGNLFIIFKGERLLVYNSIVSAATLVVGAVVGALISVKGMIVGMIVGSLLGSLPITMYLGFYRLFGFSAREIFKVWWFNYLVVVILLACYLLEIPSLTWGALGVYAASSAFILLRYYSIHLRA